VIRTTPDAIMFAPTKLSTLLLLIPVAAVLLGTLQRSLPRESAGVDLSQAAAAAAAWPSCEPALPEELRKGVLRREGSRPPHRLRRTRGTRAHFYVQDAQGGAGGGARAQRRPRSSCSLGRGRQALYLITATSRVDPPALPGLPVRAVAVQPGAAPRMRSTPLPPR